MTQSKTPSEELIQSVSEIDVPEETFAAVEIPIADLALWQASNYVEDGDTYWRSSMPVILRVYGLSYDDYWNLTVAEHNALMEDLRTLTRTEEGDGS